MAGADRHDLGLQPVRSADPAMGIATAILLEEFKPRNRLGATFHGLIQLNITNLAGVPSVVYGILGLTAFVAMFGLFNVPAQPGAAAFEARRAVLRPVLQRGGARDSRPGGRQRRSADQVHDGMRAYDIEMRPVEVNVIEGGAPYPDDPAVLDYTLFSDAEAGRIEKRAWYYFRLPFGRGVLTGALTLMLVILPIVIISSQERCARFPLRSATALEDSARLPGKSSGTSVCRRPCRGS